MTEFREVFGFSKYLINVDGIIVNKKTGKTIKRFLNAQGYYMVGIQSDAGGSCKRFVHRLIMLTFATPEDISLCINHKNGIRTDNSIDNLEFCTIKQNLSLPRFKAKGKGVYPWYIGRNKWRAAINIKGNYKTLGYYKTFEEATAAYSAAHLAVFGVLPGQPVSAHSPMTEVQLMLAESESA